MRWLLQENFGDARLALEHASVTIKLLDQSAVFGFGRWKPNSQIKDSTPKPRVEPVLIEGEQ